MYATTISVSSHTSVLLYLQVTVSLEISIPSESYNFSVSSSTQTPDSWRKGFDEDISLSMEFSKVSHNFHMGPLWVSVLVLRGSFFLMIVTYNIYAWV